MIPKTERYLTMVTAKNNNKFYRMIPDAGGATFTVKYGRIGRSEAVTSYNICQWDAKYAEKISKGYTDQSDLYAEDADTISNNGPSTELKNKKSLSIADRLLATFKKVARGFVRRNYRINTKRVTRAMISKAEQLIYQLSDQAKSDCSVEDFNRTLLDIFMAIPREMDNTKYYISHSQKDFIRIIEREAEYLDSLRGYLKTDAAPSVSEEGQTDAERFGISAWECTDAQMEEIRKMMGNDASRIVKAWRVENAATRKNFDSYVEERGIKKVRKFFHGSRTENFYSIIGTGLSLNPNAVQTGKMFGYGLYFAPKAHKSINYCSVRNSYWAGGSDEKGYLAVYDVAVGRQLETYVHGPYSNFTEKDISNAGYDSLYAKAGKELINDEVIIYSESACSIRYLIEIA